MTMCVKCTNVYARSFKSFCTENATTAYYTRATRNCVWGLLIVDVVSNLCIQPKLHKFWSMYQSGSIWVSSIYYYRCWWQQNHEWKSFLSCRLGFCYVALVEEGVKWAFLKEEMRSPPSFNNFCWLIIAQEKNDDDDVDDVNQQ